MTSENETKSIFFRTFFENVDFAKIVLSPRRRAHFQGLEPPKTDQKTSQNRCKDAFEKNAENPRPIWCHWVVQNLVSGPTWRRWACQKRRHQLPWRRTSKNVVTSCHGAQNVVPGLANHVMALQTPFQGPFDVVSRPI